LRFALAIASKLVPAFASPGLTLRLSFWSLWSLSYVLSAANIAAADLPQTNGAEVIIVYNKNVPESKSIAEYYAQKRGVPSTQIFGFSIRPVQTIRRDEFREDLEKPLAKVLHDRKLWRSASSLVTFTNTGSKRLVFRVVESKIRYAVLCYGVPLNIEEDPHLKADGAEKLRPEQRAILRNEASIDSELALLPRSDERLPLAGPFQNWVYGATNVSLLDPTNGILMVARLDGPSPEIARGLVDKALQAEVDGLWGRAYFDARGLTNSTYKLGDDWIKQAAEFARHQGFETILDDQPGLFPSDFPMSQIAIYMGWYAEDVAGALAQPTVEFVPGAVAYHLHSNSAGSLRTTNRFWVGPLLASGATVTMGCTAEPYLALTPDLGAFTYRFLFLSFSFGEAAYASQPGLSWQITVVGDPLYRPFGRPAEALHKALESRHSPLLAWSYLRLANLRLVDGRPAGEVIRLLEDLELSKRSSVLQEKLGDLYLKAGKPSSAKDSYEQALKLDPTPLQRVRLQADLASLKEKPKN
jgi:uncharacterized protein (TIGR03790 family)